jgi:uncharacterized protein DUF6861
MNTPRYKTGRDPRYSQLVHSFDSPHGIHPDAPAGGGGPGHFTSRKQYGDSSVMAYHSHDDLWDIARRTQNLYLAYTLARDKYAGAMILEETGQGLQEILEGLIPGLLTALIVVAGSTGVGAALGGAIGFLFGGLDAGLALLNYLGIGFLIIYVAEHLGEVLGLIRSGIVRAWNAGKGTKSECDDLEEAAREMARALAVLVRLILEGIVAYLLEKGVSAVTSRVGELVASLKKSKFGKGFAEWVEKNVERLINDPRLKPKKRNKTDGNGSSPGERAPTRAEREKSQSNQIFIPGRNGERHVRLDKIRFSQRRVSPEMSDGMPIAVAAENMRKNGWDYSKGVPDMVEYPDGRIVTVDHRRLVAAREARLEEVPARVHLASEQIVDEKQKNRFRLKTRFTDPETGRVYRKGQPPSNWGEAAMFRSANQRVMGYPDFPIEGSPDFPVIIDRKQLR